MGKTQLRAVAVVVAAGEGKRAGAGVPKQFRLLLDRPVIAWTLDSFERSKLTNEVILVVPSGWTKKVRVDAIEKYGFKKVSVLVVGGQTRQESVHRGFEKIKEKECVVCVHDGVRPFATPELIDRAIEAANVFGASVTAIPAKDTIKYTTDDGFVWWTLDRELMWAAQTPQCFKYKLLEAAFESAKKDGFIATDDASLVERMGEKIAIVQGEEENIKITSQLDFVLAEAIARRLSKR